MRKISPLEGDEQASLVKWFRLQYRSIAYCLFSIPNGSVLAGDKIKRAKQMNRLKSEGFVNGVSDLFLMQSNSKYHGLFIEMKKSSGGKVSDDQKEFLRKATEQGYQAVVCKGFEQAKHTIIEYLKG